MADSARMAGKTVLVTGATAGIGKATAVGLAALGARVPARVVTVSSGAHAMGRIDFDDLQGSAKYSGQRAYNASKLANIMFTYGLARFLDGTGVTATVLHPGVTNTNFGADDQAAFITRMLPLMRPFMKTPAAGAATSIYLASSAEVDGVTGRYFANRKPRTSNKASHDTAAVVRLWKVSADLVGLTPAGTT